MSKARFETQSYIQYLYEHCSPHESPDEARGRVAGMSLVRKMLDGLHLHAGDRVLEVGCGLGRLMRFLEGTYDVTAWGCDISTAVIDEARRAVPQFRDRLFVCTDASVPAPSNVFDAVVFWGVFEMTRQEQMLIETSRVLKTGGRALLCSVKSVRFRADDEDSHAARRAYIERDFPICYTRVEAFERLTQFLGFEIEQRNVFVRKRDMVDEQWQRAEVLHFDAECSDIVYVLRKVRRTPLDDTISVSPREAVRP